MNWNTYLHSINQLLIILISDSSQSSPEKATPAAVPKTGTIQRVKVLTTPAVRRIASQFQVRIFNCKLYIHENVYNILHTFAG
jgi:hypothetical protein